MMNEPIPIDQARRIAEELGKAQVIVLAWDGTGGKIHVTTYGTTAENKLHAALGGDRLSQFLELDGPGQKVHADFRRDFDAGLLREALDLIQLLHNRQGVTGPMLEQAERILKATGHGVRRGG